MSNYLYMPRKDCGPNNKSSLFSTRLRRRNNNANNASYAELQVYAKTNFTLAANLGSADSVVCFSCGGKGHKANQCPLPKKPKYTPTSSKPNPT
jgi:hypothetical protein